MDKEIFKPGRYINGEWNAAHKEWAQGMLKVALCFPDIYEIGMSHLGMKIIYGILNKAPEIVCERVFAPWEDMEKKMRRDEERLKSLESQKELKDFDIVGFSLQYEMSFVDVLNMLDLGGIPVCANERGDEHPLVIAGGPCCFNPEPMAEFIDAFVIGDAEEAILEIARLVQCSGSKDKTLRELAKIDGVYVPAVSLSSYGEASPAASDGQSPAFSIKKRIVKDLDSAYFPTSPIVPYIQIVHDRISLEIMRGCPHKCNFCQACKIFNPLRIRSVKRILEIAEESVRNTGYEEMSLLSLSTGDYPYMEELVEKLGERLKGLGVKISLPSMRAESFKSGKDGNIFKRAGLTFAPETGSDKLRARLNKNMLNEEIIQKSNSALKSGWKKVKLYFMIGLPGETNEDLDAIVKFVSQIKNASLSISPFIPKPHSGFEREGMDDLDILEEKKKHLSSGLYAIGSRKRLKINFHDSRKSRVEAILSRGDRKIGAVIRKAWQKGARLQAWSDFFNYNIWKDSFEECGVDGDFYLKDEPAETLLPWDFIQ